MGLRDLPIKQFYDSDVDDILNQFYIPALSKSFKYQRIAGFFSSRILALAARGIVQFIRNGGTMELVVGSILKKQDIDAIIAGTDTPEKIIEKNMLEELNQITEDFVKDHIRALGWMVAKQTLRVKVVIPFENGVPADYDSETSRGIFHQKVGVMVDANNDIITFSGSVNETAAGWTSNIEEFKVFRSWVSSEQPYLDSDLKKMQKFLTNQAKNALVIDIPSAVQENLIQIAPEKIDDLHLGRHYSREQPRTKVLRYYQRNAIDEWRIRKWHGVAEMATGTGKTLFALNAIKLEVPASVLTIVAIPSEVLATQWKSWIEEEFPDSLTIVCTSQNLRWKDQLPVITTYFSNTAQERRIFIVTTYQTGCTSQFRDAIMKLPSNMRCLIADEVHHAGAPQFSKILEIDCKYRLGLSATPERPWDEEGETKILDYFGGKIISYPIGQALKDKVLCEYDYHVHFVSLELDEFEEYRNLSKRIKTKISAALKTYPSLAGLSFPRLISEISKKDAQFTTSIQALLIRRATILKRARNKEQALVNIIKGSNLRRCLIYCNDTDHLQEVLRTLYDNNISALRYDSTMTAKERERNMHSFANGNSEFMVAVKCLDEGVDLPICDSAILISSSKSEREFIQRRGRLLRKHPSKNLAHIHDIVVLPVDPSLSNITISELDYQMVDSEIERVKLFASSAVNKDEILTEISNVESQLASRIT